MWVTAETSGAWRHGTWHPFANGSRGRFVLMTGIQVGMIMASRLLVHAMYFTLLLGPVHVAYRLVGHVDY